MKKTKTKKELFLTYGGILRVLFVSKSGNCQKFIKWATETLFTTQMGTIEQKNNLAADIIGVSVESLKSVLSKSARKISCVYRIVLGICKDLRKSMNISKDIPDNYLIIKYGFTDDLVRRTNEHIRTYGSIKGVKLELMNFAYIDPNYISDAETEIKEFFEDIETFIEYNKHKELVAIKPKHNRQINNMYKFLKDKYGGCVQKLNIKIEELRKEVKDKNLEIKNLIKIHKLEIMANEKDNKLELMSKDNKLELMSKENENNMLKKDLDIMRKDLEIEKLKNQLLQSK